VILRLIYLSSVPRFVLRLVRVGQTPRPSKQTPARRTNFPKLFFTTSPKNSPRPSGRDPCLSHHLLFPIDKTFYPIKFQTLPLCESRSCLSSREVSARGTFRAVQFTPLGLLLSALPLFPPRMNWDFWYPPFCNLVASFKRVPKSDCEDFCPSSVPLPDHVFFLCIIESFWTMVVLTSLIKVHDSPPRFSEHARRRLQFGLFSQVFFEEVVLNAAYQHSPRSSSSSGLPLKAILVRILWILLSLSA